MLCRCSREFARKDALKRHEQTCYRLKDLQNEDLKREIEELKRSILELKEESSSEGEENTLKKRREVYVNNRSVNTDNRVTVNNTVNIDNRKITINAFGNESLSHIRAKDVLALADNPETCITEFAKMVYSVPQNRNIQCSNLRDAVYHVADQEGMFTIPIDKRSLIQKVYLQAKTSFFDLAEKGFEETKSLYKEELEEDARNEEDKRKRKEERDAAMNELYHKAEAMFQAGEWPHDKGQIFLQLKRDWEKKHQEHQEKKNVPSKEKNERRAKDIIDESRKKVENARKFHETVDTGRAMLMAPRRCEEDRLTCYNRWKKGQLKGIQAAIYKVVRPERVV